VPLRYGKWLAGALTGDLGKSPVTGRPIASDLAQQLPVSFELAALALLVSILLGIPAGLAAAANAGRRIDYTLRSILLIFFSVPQFVTGILLVLVAALWISPLYQTSFVSVRTDAFANLRGMLLPSLAVGLSLSTQTALMTRATVLEVLEAPFIVMARAKGVTESAILYAHALRNALPPILTLQGYLFGTLVGGLIVCEQIFNLPGIGSGLLFALRTRDYVSLVATTTVLAVFYVGVNLVIDFLYPLVDPRQRAQSG
jgi:peptide/nickel transport system permease protein